MIEQAEQIIDWCAAQATRCADAAGHVFVVVDHWVTVHERATNVVAAWLLALAMAVLGTVDLLTWREIRRQRDRTAIGRTLKGKKLANAIAWYGLAILYGASLWLYYAQADVLGVWGRTAVRALVVGGVVAAVIKGLRFLWALKHRGMNR